MYKWLCSGIVLGFVSTSSFGLSKAEIIVAAQNGVYCLDSESNLKWSFPYSYNSMSGAAVGNIDNAGKPEILVGAADTFYCISYDGNLKWSYPISTEFCSPTIANIDTIGNPEVFVVAGSCVLYCFRSDGTIKWSYGMSGNRVCPAVTVANVDGIGTPEVLAATNLWLYCINSNGDVEWSYEMIDTLLARPGGIAVADIDLNGSPEILVGNGPYMYCLKGDGSEKWRYLGESEISQPAIADINKDGKVEIVVHTFSAGFSEPRKIVAFQENVAGTGLDTVWIARCWDKSAMSAEAPVICDIDGDGDKDVMWVGDTAGSGDNMEGLLYILNGMDGRHPDNSGDPCYTNSNFADGTLYERGVAVADIDADGHVEIVGIKCGGGAAARAGVAVLECNTWASGRNLFASHLYHISDINDDLTIPRIEPNNWESHNTWLTQLTTGGSGFGSPIIKWIYTDPAMGWITHSIAIATLYNPAGVKERLEIRDKRLEIRVYPNPSTSGVRVQWSGISEKQKISLRIYDLSGRLVKALTPNPLSLTTAVEWDGKDKQGGRVENGVYFVRLAGQAKKVVLIR